jgi:hypothetical protein
MTPEMEKVLCLIPEDCLWKIEEDEEEDEEEEEEDEIECDWNNGFFYKD